MTNFEKMKPGLPPGTGIEETAKALAKNPGCCVFCIDGIKNLNESRAAEIKCRRNCEEGVREWLLMDCGAQMDGSSSEIPNSSDKPISCSHENGVQIPVISMEDLPKIMGNTDSSSQSSSE